jgi:4-diphosphocytidyl-2-C-methyl-D-erythritol kinase
VTTYTETAYAKINLALHVRRRRADGYHELETLFAFAKDGDVLSAESSDAMSLSISGPFAAGLSASNDNLVLRAATGLRDAFGLCAGAALHLDKRLPVASGIGGGSADAAAALRLLARLWDVPLDDARVGTLAARLGADVPACVMSQTQRGSGIGDVIETISQASLTGMPLLLVNPGIPLSTAPAFQGWDGIDLGPLADGDPLTAALAGRNDLTSSAIKLVPEIAALLGALSDQPDVILARMSGSGATCFGVFATREARDSARMVLERQFPDLWCLTTALR